MCTDRHHCIGKLEFILEEHRVQNKVIEEIKRLQKEGKTVVVISSNRAVKGVIAIEDEVRSDAQICHFFSTQNGY